MPKTWEQLTPEEKIDDLRNDVVKLFEEARAARRERQVLGESIGRVDAKLTEVAKAVFDLQKRLGSGQP
jgi:hypothetical protein